MRVAWSVAVAGVILSGVGCGGSGSGGGEDRGGAPAQSAAAEVIDSPAGGTTQWVRRLGGLGGELVDAMAAGSDGSVTLLTRIHPTLVQATTASEALGLVRLDRTGAVIWSRELPNVEHASLESLSIAVSPLGNVFVVARIGCGPDGGCLFDPGAGLVGGSVLVKFDPRGNFVWQYGPFPEIASNVAVDANGGPIVVIHDDGGTAFLRKWRWDGVKLWDVLAPQVNDPPNPRWAVAFDPDGNIVVGNRVSFSKLDASGRLLWSANAAADTGADGEVVSIGTTAIGTVVAVMNYTGIVRYAATEGAAGNHGGAFIAVAESSGAPRFGRELGVDLAAVAASVDPAGRLAILTRDASCSGEVWKWNLAGDLVWRRPLATTCNAENGVLPLAISAIPTSHDVAVAGGMWGTVDFGTGPATSRGGVDDFVVDIAP